MAKIWRIDPNRPDKRMIAKAADVICQGGVVVVPTRNLYGLCGNAFDADAVQHIFKIKGRPADKALLLLIDNRAALARVALSPNAMAMHLMHCFWPGGVTFLLFALPELPPALTSGSGKIGVRMVAHPVAKALVRAVGEPLTGTSANISGAGGCVSVDRMDAHLLDAVDGVLDAGPLAGGRGSTIVDVTGAFPEVIREGSVPAQRIMACFEAFEAEGLEPL